MSQRPPAAGKVPGCRGIARTGRGEGGEKVVTRGSLAGILRRWREGCESGRFGSVHLWQPPKGEEQSEGHLGLDTLTSGLTLSRVTRHSHEWLVTLTSGLALSRVGLTLRIASSSRVLGGTHWGQEEKSSSVVTFHGGASWLLINRYRINVKINLTFCEFHIQYSTHEGGSWQFGLVVRLLSGP